MPSLYQLKPAFQGMLRPLVARLASAGITANQVTIGTCLASIALGAWLFEQQRGWMLLPVFLFARMALNAIDGMLAREYKQASTLGAILNELTDVISDAALTIPFAAAPGWNPIWICGAIFFAALTEIGGLAALSAGKQRRFDGPFGKSDRALALGVLGTWLALGWPVAAWAATAAPALWIVLCSITVVQRIRRALS
jgi:CDP-diacylglycerol--glycerol-3-phosphate 3-phosphatidyltransferase